MTSYNDVGNNKCLKDVLITIICEVKQKRKISIVHRRYSLMSFPGCVYESVEKYYTWIRTIIPYNDEILMWNSNGWCFRLFIDYLYITNYIPDSLVDD